MSDGFIVLNYEVDGVTRPVRVKAVWVDRYYPSSLGGAWVVLEDGNGRTVHVEESVDTIDERLRALGGMVVGTAEPAQPRVSRRGA